MTSKPRIEPELCVNILTPFTLDLTQRRRKHCHASLQQSTEPASGLGTLVNNGHCPSLCQSHAHLSTQCEDVLDPSRNTGPAR